MVESSMPWDATDIGDAAALAPYDADTWDSMYENLFANEDNQGILREVLNELVATDTGGGTPVDVASGAAVVKGKYYENTAVVSFVIAAPAVSTRIDRIVVRTTWPTKQSRLTHITGVEGGAAPALVQVDGTTWDIPICQFSVTTGGVIVVTDEREEAEYSSSWNSFLRITERMGGDATGWATSGLTDYDVTGNVDVQVGTLIATVLDGTRRISNNITFPHAYPSASETPVVIGSPWAATAIITAYRPIVHIKAISHTQFNYEVDFQVAATGDQNVQVQWMAIGPIA